MVNKECKPETSDSAATIKLPVELLMALSENEAASKVFDCLEAADQREYIDWIAGGGSAEARGVRAGQAMQMLLEGDGKRK